MLLFIAFLFLLRAVLISFSLRHLVIGIVGSVVFRIADLESILVLSLGVFFPRFEFLTAGLSVYFFYNVFTFNVVALDTIQSAHVVVLLSVRLRIFICTDRDLKY